MDDQIAKETGTKYMVPKTASGTLNELDEQKIKVLNKYSRYASAAGRKTA